MSRKGRERAGAFEKEMTPIPLVAETVRTDQPVLS
jgi:hypothetical protein